MRQSKDIAAEIRQCTLCAGHMPRPPRPVFRLSPKARTLIASQAPGNLAFESGIPFSDPSGERLRQWLGMDRVDFYDRSKVAIVPMGFCFPGHDRHGGDLPPMPICATTWRRTVIENLTEIRLSVLIGAHAQRWHLKLPSAHSLTKTVERWRDWAPQIFVTPHPSWRNNAWLKRNPWFELECLPALKRAVRETLS